MSANGCVNYQHGKGLTMPDLSMTYGELAETLAGNVAHDQPSSGNPVYPKAPVSMRLTKSQILEGLDHCDYDHAWKSAHNEVTRRQGTIITVRLIQTDILRVEPTPWGGCRVDIDTGGWNTQTTFQHLMGAIQRHTGAVVALYRDKKTGRNVLRYVSLEGTSCRHEWDRKLSLDTSSTSGTVLTVTVL